MPISWDLPKCSNPDTFVAVADATTWVQIGTQIADVLLVLADKIASIPPDSWNRIYVEHWPDSGRLIFYPHKRGDPRGTRAFTVVMTSEFLQQEYDALPGPDDGVPLWETYHIALWGKRNLAIGRATDNPAVVTSMLSLAKSTDFTAWNQESDDPEAVSPIYFIPRNRKK